MPKVTILYGGAFDPPHLAHQAAATQALNYLNDLAGCNDLWFLPCYSDAFGKKDMSEPKHRVAMLELMINNMGDPRMGICVEEIEMANRAGTFAVVRHLMKSYPGRQFIYMIGTDQANKIREWRNSRDLVKTLPFIVIRRAGVHGWYGSGWYRNKPHFFMDEPPYKKPMSSTSVRQDIMDNRAAWMYQRHQNLAAGVHSYIMENGLYMPKKEKDTNDAKLNALLSL